MDDIHNISLINVINQNYELLYNEGFCNNIYDIYLTINTTTYKISDFVIGIQCIPENDNLTGVFILLPSKQIKYQPNTIIPIDTLTLIDANGKTLTEKVQNFKLNYLTEYNAFLVKKSNEMYKEIAPDKNQLYSKITSMEDMIVRTMRDKTTDLISHTGLLNRADIIENQLDLLDVDGVKDKSDNMLSAFNDDSLFTVDNPVVFLNGSVNLENTKINSMDCFIASLPDSEREEKNKIRLKYGIIRTVIDFFHDYVNVAVEIFPLLLNFINDSNVATGLVDPSILDDINKIYKKVTTSGGNVSQNACKNLWSEYAIRYRQELSISFFPISEFGNLGSADIYKDATARTEFTEEFNKICSNLKRDFGIHFFYIEAQNTPLATAFVKQGFGMVTSNIAVRDAAPGYSIKRAYGEGLANKNAIIIDRKYNDTYQGFCPEVTDSQSSNVAYGTRVTIQNGPNCLLSKFLGLSDMAVMANDTTNTIISKTKFGDREIKVENNGKEKIMELGLNALIETTNKLTGTKFPQLRGAGKASAISQVKAYGSPLPNKLDIISIMSLKTYTDYCQTDEIEQLKNINTNSNSNARVIAASSDFLASRTFSDFFATPAVYVGVNHVTVTCSDTRYSSLTQEQLYMKLNIFNKLIIYKDVIKKYIEQNIYREYGYIRQEQNTTLSPSIYYGSNTLILSLEQTLTNSNQTIDDITLDNKIKYFNTLTPDEQMNFLKQFPDALSLYISGLCKFSLSSQIFKETHDKISDIIFLIISIPNRISKDAFLDIFYKVEQELTNSLPTTISQAEFTINLIAVYTVAIATKTEHAKNSFVTNLAEQITYLSPEDPEESRLLDIFTKMSSTIEFIFLLNKNVSTQLTPEIRNNFIPAVPDVFRYEIQPVEGENTERLEEIAIVIPELNTAIETIENINDQIDSSQNLNEIHNLSQAKEEYINHVQKATEQLLDRLHMLLEDLKPHGNFSTMQQFASDHTL